MGEEGAREQCVLAGRLEEIGCVAVGGRGHESQQCQGKPDELPAAKLGERSIRSMLRSLAVGICSTKTSRRLDFRCIKMFKESVFCKYITSIPIFIQCNSASTFPERTALKLGGK